MATKKRPQQANRAGQSQTGKNTANTGTIRADTNKSSASFASDTPKAIANSASGSTGASKLASIRAGSVATATKSSGLARRAPAKRFKQDPWWKRNLGPIITVAAVVLVIGGFVAFALYQNSLAAAGILSPVPSSIMKTLTTVPESTFEKVAKGTTAIQFESTPAGTPVKTANGKPEIIYVGAEYCPYCAAERWGTVIALSRFGTFSNLKLMRSDPNDVYPNTATLTFRNSTYTSQYISFNATETEDRNGNKLDTPPADAVSILTTYDSSTYTSSPGSIPFMSYGNQWVTIGAPFTPTMMQGLDWNQMQTQLQDPNSDVSQAVISSANYQTAAICALTNNQPGSVCNTTIVKQLEATLPAAK